MSNKAKYHRKSRDEAIQGLLAQRREDGSLPVGALARASEACGYSPRQLRRRLRVALASPEQDSAMFAVDEQVMTAVFLTCGRLAGAYRMLRGAGRPNLPSDRHFRRMVTEEMGTMMLTYARGGSRGARDVRISLTNEVPTKGHTIQMDHTELPIWVVPRGHKRPVRPWLTVAMDPCHRYPLAWVVTFGRPTAEEVASCLMQAISLRTAPDGKTIVGGRPVRVVWDRGLEFLANRITESCMRLLILPYALPAFSPHLKAQLERFWRFLKEDMLPPLPGYTDYVSDMRGNSALATAALGEDEFIVKLAEWMDWYVTEHVHSTLGCTPVQSWSRDQTPLDEVPENQLWQDFLISKNHVIVQKMGVRFDKTYYIGPGMETIVGRKVEVRHLAHDRSFIEVFLDGNHLCTATPQSALTEQQEQDILTRRTKAQQAARARFTVANRVRRDSFDSTQMLDRDRNGKPIIRENNPPAEVEDLFTGGQEALERLLHPETDPEPGQMTLL